MVKTAFLSTLILALSTTQQPAQCGRAASVAQDTAIVRGNGVGHGKRGTFTTTTAGLYDTESQAFSQLDKIVKGTDRFSNRPAGSFFSPASFGKVTDLIRALAASYA